MPITITFHIFGLTVTIHIKAKTPLGKVTILVWHRTTLIHSIA